MNLCLHAPKGDPMHMHILNIRICQHEFGEFRVVKSVRESIYRIIWIYYIFIYEQYHLIDIHCATTWSPLESNQWIACWLGRGQNCVDSIADFVILCIPNM